MTTPWTLTARWLIPIDGPPLPHGTVTIAGERIAAVEPHGQRAPDLDLGNVALLPGFVNAHTHLDLSGLRGKCPPTPDFTGWLRGVIAHRRSQTIEQIAFDITEGYSETLRCGTTLLGDIDATGYTSLILAYEQMRLVVFYEVLGLSVDRAEAALSTAADRLAHHRNSPTCRAGLSPHAPYSVRETLYASVAQLAKDRSVCLATHLAESPAEIELLENKSGPFVDFLTELGAWTPPKLPAPAAVVFGWHGLAKRPANYVKVCRKHTSALLLVHCNYLPTNTLIPREATIVYCPRTHAAFGHPPHPFREFLRRGVRVALGTDSLASNPDLDILAEARFVHRHYPDVPVETVLRMITLSGAEALGWSEETGSLTPGKSADLVVLPLPDADDAEPCTLVLQSANSVTAVLFRGQWTVGQP